MNIGVLGTGMVGNSIAGKLISLGHSVKMGSRYADNEEAKEWVNKSGANASQGTFRDAASFGEILFLCLHGAGTLDALEMAGTENFNNKLVIDITNPLDFSKACLRHFLFPILIHSVSRCSGSFLVPKWLKRLTLLIVR